MTSDESTRRGVMKAGAAAVALGIFPGSSAGESDNSDPVLTEAEIEQLQRTDDLKRDTMMHGYVDLPEAVWADAKRRAQLDTTERSNPELLTSYLMDYFYLEFGFVVDGEVVHTSEGFDPNEVVGSDGEPIVDPSTKTGKGDHGDG